MADKKFTMLELHLHSDGGLQFGPKSIGRKEADEEEAEDEFESASKGGRGKLAAFGVIGLVVVAVGAVAAKKLLGHEPDLEGIDFEDTVPVEAPSE